MDKLLTEPEVAEILRCHRSKVKRLRLAGQLTYLVGRPVLIRESDLEAYIESVTRRAEEKKKAASTEKTPRQKALEKVLLRRDTRSRKR